MPTRNVNLTDHYDQFIEASIIAGRFTNASEAVRAALYLLERQEAEDNAKLERLRKAVQEGLDAIERGDHTTLETDEDFQMFFSDVRREATAIQSVLNQK